MNKRIETLYDRVVGDYLTFITNTYIISNMLTAVGLLLLFV